MQLVLGVSLQELENPELKKKKKEKFTTTNNNTDNSENLYLMLGFS